MIPLCEISNHLREILASFIETAYLVRESSSNRVLREVDCCFHIDKRAHRKFSIARYRMGACRYQSVKSIVKNSLDAVPPAEAPPSSPPPPHHNIRGAEYFD
jgi:hypothetical protein